MSGGYADIDPDYGNTNADRFMRGRRVFELVTVRVLRDRAGKAIALVETTNALLAEIGSRD